MMLEKIRSLGKPGRVAFADSISPFITNRTEEIDRDRLGQDAYPSHASKSVAVTPANVAKYEEALKTLACELECVKEHERQKIADQLHDEFGQDLVLAKMKLGQLLDKLPPRYGGCVEEIDAIIGDLIRHTRAVIHELYPQQLCETGLTAALQSLAEEIQTKHGLICTAKIELTSRRLKDEVQEVLFRAVRELLLNVVKHARASRAKIALTCSPDFVVIEVCDDGQGFDRHKSALSNLSIGRFGLFSVRARLAQLGGNLRIFSRVGKGTRAIITLPTDGA